MLHLQQKLNKIAKTLTKLNQKHYTDDVDYQFVKIETIYENINQSFSKSHICMQKVEKDVL